MAKLKSLLEEVLKESSRGRKHEVIESVRAYGTLGTGLYKNNVLEVASKLSEIPVLLPSNGFLKIGSVLCDNPNSLRTELSVPV